MIAHQCGLQVGEFIWTGGDCHIYSNHLEQVHCQLSRQPHAVPQLNILRKPESLFDYCFDDFALVDYKYHPAIKAAVAV
jgi:thymidylate synthase